MVIERSSGRAHESDPTRVVNDLVMRHSSAAGAGAERSRRLNPVTVPAEVVGSSIGRLSHHRMMSGDECDGLELVRRPYNGCGITRLAVRALFDLRRGLAPQCEWSCSQLRCDRSQRTLSTVLTASTPGMVLAIKNRTWEAFKRSYYSLVTFSP